MVELLLILILAGIIEYREKETIEWDVGLMMIAILLVENSDSDEIVLTVECKKRVKKLKEKLDQLGFAYHYDESSHKMKVCLGTIGIQQLCDRIESGEEKTYTAEEARKILEKGGLE